MRNRQARPKVGLTPVLGLMLVLVLVAAACGGDTDAAATEPEPTAARRSSATRVPTEPPADASSGADSSDSDATGSAPTDRPIVSGTVEEWAQLVVSLRLDEAERLQASFVENTIDVTPETFGAAVLGLCTEESAIRDDIEAQLPASYGSDPIIAEVYEPWLDARAVVRAEIGIGCEITAEIQEELSFEWAPEPGSPAAISAEALEAAREAELMACFPLQEAISFIAGDIFNCDGNTDCPDCPTGPSGDEGPRTDVSVCDGPTEGPIGGLIALPAGPCDLTWFPVPFSIDPPQDLVATSGSDFLWLETPNGGFFVEIHAPEVVADPSALEPYEIGETVPVPPSLGDWFDQLPLEVIEEEDVGYPGGIAVRRLIRADREAMIVAVGEEAITLWPGGFSDVVLAGFEGGESRYVWELRTAEGRLVTIQGLYEDPFGFTATGLTEWVETVILANLRFG